jgi:purine-binding chemotaxis protein CheW
MNEIRTASQCVTFCLGPEVFAVPVSMVREILDYRDAFRIPDGPAFLLGLIDVRGHGVPVVDLRAKLGMEPTPTTPSTRIMVVDVPLNSRVLALGLVADKVLEVATFAAAEVEPAPDLGIPWRSEYIDGVVRRHEGFVVLFDLPRLLSAADVAKLAPAIAADCCADVA